MAESRRKTANLNVRVTEDEKLLAEACAEADNRSLTNYVVALIKADAARRGIKHGPKTDE